MVNAPAAPRTPWPRSRRVAAVLAVWVVAVAGALLVAGALDDPVGSGARDESQPVGPELSAASPSAELPPLALILDRAPPPSVTRLPAREQIPALQRLARTTSGPRHLIELGSVLQSQGAYPGAGAVFRRALERSPGDVGARTGLALNLGAGGDPAGLARAAAELDALARERPRSQIVAFNIAWVAIYRDERQVAATALTRAIGLDEDSRLGRLGIQVLATLDPGGSGRQP